jgi:geranylgeranylglycerol-phosphate geranylgeranyltransferase
MMGIAVIVGSILSNPYGVGDSFLNLIFGFITGFSLTAASMTINDYYDREIDIINEPQRPIPSGLITPINALIFSLILTIIGFIGATINSILVNSLFSLIIASIAWVIFIMYTTIGKRSGLPGNFLVSACVSIPFIYGNVAVLKTIELRVLIFVLMVFLSNTGREIIKGIVDIPGDKVKKINTLAIRFGGRSASIIATIFILSAVLLSPIPLILNIVSILFIPPVIITNIGLLTSSLLILKDHSRHNSRKVKNIILISFIFGLISFIMGSINV